MPFAQRKVIREGKNDPVNFDDTCTGMIKVALAQGHTLDDRRILVTATYREDTIDPTKVREATRDQKRDALELLKRWREEKSGPRNKHTLKSYESLRLDKHHDVQIQDPETGTKTDEDFENFQLQINDTPNRPSSVAKVIVRKYEDFIACPDYDCWKGLVSAGLQNSVANNGATVWIFQQYVDPRTKKIVPPQKFKN